MTNNVTTVVVLTVEFAVILKQFNSVNNSKAVLVDNSSTNTGCEAGLVPTLEK